MIELIGVPFDGCGSRLGSRLGPAAIRLAGLAEVIESLGLELHQGKDLLVANPSHASAGLKHFDAAFPVYELLKAEVRRVLEEGSTPFFIGGDHSLSIGSIAGALAASDEPFGVLWVDAHADLNAPWTSPSGNIHGMVLGALTHRSDQDFSPGDWWETAGGTRRLKAVDDWNALLESVVGPKPLPMSHIGWFGLRDVDGGEQKWLREQQPGFVATMFDIDRYSVAGLIEHIRAWLEREGLKKLWISFDVDALDPILAPGTGTAVRGGLTYREMHVMGELLYEMLFADDQPYQLLGLDLVEINPLFDTNNETARTAIEWIASLFGKTILGKGWKSPL